MTSRSDTIAHPLDPTTPELLITSTDNYQDQLVNNHSPLPDIVKSNFRELIDTYLSTAQRLFDEISKSESPNEDLSNDSVLFHYRLPEAFKNIALLHRDVLLQLFITKSKEVEGGIPESSAIAHLKESRKILQGATDSFIQFIHHEIKVVNQQDKNSSKLLSGIKHQQNPWPVYFQQFDGVLSHFGQIDAAGASINEVIKAFDQIITQIKLTRNEIGDKLKHLTDLVAEAINTLNTVTEISDLNGIITWIDRTVENREPIPERQKSFNNFLDGILTDLKILEIPIASQDGLLINRKIELGKVVLKWADYEILPRLIELWNTEEAMESHFNINLLNLKSGLMVAKSNKVLASLQTLLQSLETLQSTLSESIKKHQTEAAQTEKLLSDGLKITRIFDNEEFLEVSLQSSIAQYSLAKNNLVARAKGKLQRLFLDLGSRYEEAHLPTDHKRLEAAIECISYRMTGESDSSYDALFRSKSLIGDLFIVAREEPEHLFVESLQRWNKGFGQASLVIGDGLSGKSTFMEYLARKHFGKQVIKLEINSTIIVEGRKLKTTQDLGECLKFVINNIYHTKPLILIDNLELWRGNERVVLDNVRSLLRFVELKSDDVYVMVSISTAMQQLLDRWIQFTPVFTTLLNINKSKIEEIYKAVLIRHGAAHKTLVTPGGQTLTPKRIERSVRNLCKTMNYNIGEVLQAWTYNTTVEENKIVYLEREFTFEDFFSLQEILLLKHVTLHKQIDEVGLKQLLGERSNYFMSGLKRLINTRVLIRNESGELHLNSTIQNDVRDILKFRGILE